MALNLFSNPRRQSNNYVGSLSARILPTKRNRLRSSTASVPPSKRRFMVLTRFIFRLVSALRVLPMRWDEKSQKFRLPPPFSLHRIVQFLSVFVAVMEASFGIFRLIHITWLWAIDDKNDDKRKFLRQFLSLFAPLMTKFSILVFSFNVLFRTTEATEFANKLIAIRQEENLKRDGPKTAIFLASFLLRCIQMTLVSCLNPSRLNFWYSALPGEWKTWETYLIHLLFSIRAATMVFTIPFLVINLLLYLETLEHVLRTPSETVNHSTLYGRLLRYRRCQVLSTLFIHTYGAMSVPYISFHSLFGCVCFAFGSIRYYDVLDGKVYIQMPMTLLTLLMFDGIFYSRAGNLPRFSKEAIRHWFERDEGGVTAADKKKLKLLTRMYKCSCRGISVGRIKHTFLVSLFRNIVVLTLRMLILTSEIG